MASIRIDNGEMTLSYELSGPAAAPVVCLNHCFASDRRYWDAHLPAFDGFRVLRHDARGHGGSDAPAGPYSLDMMAGDVVGLLDALEIAEVHICGVSMGGMVAQTVALDYPDWVASLALVNTTSEYTAEQVQAWRDRAELVRRDGMSAVHRPLLERWFTEDAIRRRIAGYRFMDDAIGRFTPEAFVAASAAMCGLDTTARLSQIKVPSIVIATPDDPGVPTEVSEKMARLLGAPLHWLAPAHHLATLEHVDAFNGLIRGFLRDAAPDR